MSVLLLESGVTGCVCRRPYFVGLEGPEGLHVVERSWSSQDYFLILWAVPTRYELVRPSYRIEARTPVSRPYSYPRLVIHATDPDGRELSVWDPNQPYRLAQTLENRHPKKGTWSFDVNGDGEVIGRETIHYELRSRPIACGWYSVEF